MNQTKIINLHQDKNSKKLEKMSKSRGNAISIDECLHTAYIKDNNFEFLRLDNLQQVDTKC